MLEEFLLDPKEELKLRLVKYNQIPASIIALSMRKDYLDIYKIETNTTIQNDRLKTLYNKKIIKQEIIQKFKKYLEQNKIHNFENNPLTEFNINARNNLLCKNTSFTISKNPRILHALLDNMNPAQFLQITGWPEEEAHKFVYNQENITKDKNYVMMNFAKAKQENKLPEWGAYLLFIPSRFDLINNDIQLKTIGICNKIRKHVQKKNPGLAQRIEQDFQETSFPEKWSLQGNQYMPHFNFYELQRKLQVEQEKKLN